MIVTVENGDTLLWTTFDSGKIWIENKKVALYLKTELRMKLPSKSEYEKLDWQNDHKQDWIRVSGDYTTWEPVGNLPREISFFKIQGRQREYRKIEESEYSEWIKKLY